MESEQAGASTLRRRLVCMPGIGLKDSQTVKGRVSIRDSLSPIVYDDKAKSIMVFMQFGTR